MLIGGEKSTVHLQATFESNLFDVVLISVESPAQKLAVRALCARHGRQVPRFLRDPMQAVSSLAARALVLVGQSESLVPVLNLAPVGGKPVFVTHPPFAAAEATRKNELLRHADRIHVGMVSAHDANVDEMEAAIRGGIIGEVTGLTIMGSESDAWDEMEALNIARRAHGGNVHDTWKGGNDSNNNGCCVRKVPTLNGQVGQVMVHVRGARGSLQMPAYSKRDRVQALPAMLNVFYHSTQSMRDKVPTLEAAVASWSLRSSL